MCALNNSQLSLTYQNVISTLAPQHKIELAIQFLQKAIVIWNEYAEKNELQYIDTVVGMHHEVKNDIIARTLETASRELNNPGADTATIKALQYEFTDPIVALQDSDWELPYEAERTFYLAYNLLEHLDGKLISVFNEETIYVSINQSIDALTRKGLMSDAEVERWITQFGHRPV